MGRVCAILVLLLAAGCKLPADPDGTLARVKNGVLRVGLTEPSAEQQRRVVAFARALGARLEVRPGSEHQLVRALEAGELDLIAPLPSETPFADRAGLSRPVPAGAGDDGWVWVVAAGENAFLLEVNRFLANTTERR